MNRSWTRFRRALLALSFVGAMGFGATQAAAAPEQARFQSCPFTGSGPQIDDDCDLSCRQKGYDYGYCGTGGFCVCKNFRFP
jgi:hypothetical protein